MSKPRLLLASQSPRRRELLALLGLPFDVTVADVAEAPRAGETPAALVARLSQEKARAVAVAPGTLVIACDTVVALDGRILGKPDGTSGAATMLRRLRGRPHTVYSAITLADAADCTRTDVAGTRVVMRAYSDAEIAAYVASGDPLDKAGAYAIQHDRFHPVAEIDGCYASVMGFPLCHLVRSLRAWEIKPVGNVPDGCQKHNRVKCAVYASVLNDK